MPERLLVIDTQSVLDWLVFQDPACDDWGETLSAGGWSWIATLAMKAEFDHVLGRGLRVRHAWSVEAVSSAWARLARIVEAPAALAPSVRLPCMDPDDQKFIDLAMVHGACDLVTRDKALLRLARRAAGRRAVWIGTPLAWNRARADGDGSPPVQASWPTVSRRVVGPD